MWLIDTTTMKLDQVVDLNGNPYAILSHTWEEEEVTFQEFQDLETAQQKKGFAKIRETCRLAASRGLQYAWVDTCCIDKSSSAEVSESINSMFRWYEKSSECIVFLSDLPSSPDPDADFRRQFPECRWLTRGFTLQELIAPKCILFYDSEWGFRGTKQRWTSLISETTRIDQDVLKDSEHLSSLPVGRRMSWASKRETTKEEDKAYCLLGIFDINMPLIYGEGPKAFTRLQEEIAKQTCDLTLFAWRQEDPDPLYRGILAKSPSEFSHCGSLKHKVPDTDLTNEYTFTNKGLRIDTNLCISLGRTKDFIWNLGCVDSSLELRREHRGFLGVVVMKTTIGYVRVTPNLPLFEGGPEQYGPTISGTIYMRGHLNKQQYELVNRRFQDAILIILPDTLRIAAAAPEALWDQNRSMFLVHNHLVGINGYVRLELFEKFNNCALTSFIVGFSTMGPGAICAVWPQTNPVFPHIHEYMNSEKLAHFIAEDYFRWKFIHPETNTATSETVVQIGSLAKSMIYIRVRIQRQLSDPHRTYHLHVEVSRRSMLV
ncbi:hypothetical protein NPX13_g2264 [Xylaria arbuscula]|uniref:Heterokaryon incompatibility domain-containing protein n=1 Tax=Xylaria arbuscula TaxID=114810 RepID=A0A9W8NJX4_9PEZI|nr:hypothetical protein NPX13_g2264 [Xylaria arbuscula]